MPSKKSRKKPQDVSARRRRMQQKGKVPWTYIVPALIIVVVIVGVIYIESRTPVSSSALPPSGSLQFPFGCLGAESTFIHIHPWIQIFVNGQRVEIPPAIGIKYPILLSNGYYSGGSNSCFEPVHTHDASGIVHIESSLNTNYTLGDFFNIWAETYQWVNVSNAHRPISFNSTGIFGYPMNGTASLTLLVDGKKSTLFDNLVLNTLDYCSAQNSVSSSSPCYLSASGSDPEWNGQTTGYPFGTGHTIVIEYNSTG